MNIRSARRWDLLIVKHIDQKQIIYYLNFLSNLRKKPNLLNFLKLLCTKLVLCVDKTQELVLSKSGIQ